jgi:hypothetical protein
MPWGASNAVTGRLKLRLNRKVADQGRQNPAKYSGLWFVCVFLEFAFVASMPVQHIVF